MEELTYTGTMKQIKAKVSFMRGDVEGLYDLTIKTHRNKRSLNANAYMWSLICKIADIVRSEKDAIYIEELRKYGQFDIVELRSEADPKTWWKYYDIIGEVKHDGISFRQVKVYRGTSEYDSREMAIILDGVINDATEMGIPTITDVQIERMKGAWGK